MTRGECMAMLGIAGVIYGKSVSDPLVDAWMEFMRDIAPDEGVTAMRSHVSESRFFPTVADIRERVATVRVAPVDAARAWEEVRRGIQRCGSYHEPAWTSQSIEAAVRALGWRDICMTMERDLPTLRAQFERYLKAGIETAKHQQNVGRLAEAQAIQGGQHSIVTRYPAVQLSKENMEAARANPLAYEVILTERK